MTTSDGERCPHCGRNNQPPTPIWRSAWSAPYVYPTGYKYPNATIPYLVTYMLTPGA